MNSTADSIIQSEEVVGFRASEKRLAASARQFYRCEDCLAVVAMDGSRRELETGWDKLGAACGACGGRMEHMGQVGSDPHRLVKLSERSQCDDRCTMAVGPKCECKCGGENHGSRLIVVVTLDAGERPTVTPSRDIARHRLAAVAYRTVRDAARVRIETRYRAAMDAKWGGYVDAATFLRYREGKRVFEAFWAAVGMRSHAGRNKALARICANGYEDGIKSDRFRLEAGATKEQT